MDYTEFTTQIQKRRGPKTMMVRNSWGVYDIYKHIRKNGWYNIERPVTEKEFYAIIRGINNLLAEEVAKGNTVKFPWGMGKLELRKIKVGVSLLDGKLVNTYPINWDGTMRLWYEDEEARKNKTLLRWEGEYSYHVKYNKFDATYENQCFYEFTLNRFIKRALGDNIKKGKIDVLW